MKSMRNKVDFEYFEPAPEPAEEPKARLCLACRTPFQSAWAGERVCPKCKSRAGWHRGRNTIWS